MNDVDTIVWVLIAVFGTASLIVAGIVLVVGLVIRRVLLRVERMVLEVDDARIHVMEEAERLITASHAQGSRIMKFAFAIVGALLAQRMSHKKTKSAKKKHEKQ